MEVKFPNDDEKPFLKSTAYADSEIINSAFLPFKCLSNASL